MDKQINIGMELLVYNGRNMQKYELALMIKKVYDLDMEIKPKSADKFADKTLSTIIPHKVAMPGLPNLGYQIQQQKEYEL